MSRIDFQSYPNAAALADAAAQAIAARLAEGLAARGQAGLCATGGRSPGAVYDRLRRAELDWIRITITLSDERCVPPDDPQSNLRLLNERLRVPATVLPLWPKPEPAALAALSPFDAVMLGMGEDGHIASLIPGSPTLAQGLDPDGEAMILDTPAGLGAPPLPRVTLTLAALLRARAIFLLIAGQAKREVIAAAQGGADLPVRALLAQDRAPVCIFWTPEPPV